MGRLNFRHLHAFWTIAREGGVVRASERLNVAASALSTQLRDLEARLGHSLFERKERRLVLTEAGRLAFDHADAIFRTGDELVAALDRRGTPARQALHVGAVGTLSRNFQIGFLAPMIRRPGVRIVLRSGGFRDLLSRLDDGVLDLLLANAPAPAEDAARRSLLVGTQPVSLVGHPRPAGQPFRFPQDLAGLPLILPAEGSAIRAAFDALADELGLRPVVAAEVEDMAMLRLLVRDGEGAALVPPLVVRDELSAGVLAEWCRVPGLSESFYAVTRVRQFPNPLADELIAAARGRSAPG